VDGSNDSGRQAEVIPSPGWYVAELVEEITVSGDARNVLHRNLVLVRAATPEEAYAKATNFGLQSEVTYENPLGQKVDTRFHGIAQLDVMYDEPEDGAEVTFVEVIGVPEQEVRSWIPTKERLRAFLPPERSSGPSYSSREILEEAKSRFGS
jgi:hypothetical protein